MAPLARSAWIAVKISVLCAAGMPRRSILDRQSLIALGPERLADLLLELAGNDAALKRQLRLAVASGTSPADAAALVRERLAAIQRSRTFLDWQKIKPLAKDLASQRLAITGPIARQDPAIALALLWEFLAVGNSVLSRCDDSNGVIGGLFREACRQLGPLAQAAQPDPGALALQVFEAFCANDYGLYDALIPTLAEALGPTGLAALQAQLEQLGREPVPVPPREEWRAVMWGSGGTRYAHELADQSRQWTVTAGLQAVARALGDVDGYIGQFSEQQRRAPRIAADIAEKLLRAGRPDEALDALMFGAPRPGGWVVLDWEDARIAVLQALGRTEEAQAARWECFRGTMDGSYLQDYLSQLPPFEDVEAEQRAIELAASNSDVLQGLNFLLNWPTATAVAARVLLEHHADLLNGDHYYLFSAAAEQLNADHPLAATVALRSMVDFTLSHARSSRYGYAADHLHTCQLLSRRITDWGPVTPHEVYMASIRSNHARKSAFWSKAKALGL